MAGYSDSALTYKKYGGYGNDSEIERIYGKSISITEAGIFSGVLNIPWTSVSKIIDFDDRTLHFYLYDKSYLNFIHKKLFFGIPFTKGQTKIFIFF